MLSVPRVLFVEEAAPSPLPPTPWEVEEGPTEDRERVIDGARRGAAARASGGRRARQRSPGSAHREAREPAGGANDRQRRGDNGGMEGDATSGQAGGEPVTSDDRERPL